MRLAILRAQWTLSNAGQVDLSGSSDATNGGSGNLGTVGRKVGYLRCSGGRYRLDLDVLSDTSVLNTGNPRLKVEADGEGYNYLGRLYDELPIVPGMFVVVGGTLLLLSRTEEKAEQSTVIEVSVPRHRASKRRFSPKVSSTSCVFGVAAVCGYRSVRTDASANPSLACDVLEGAVEGNLGAHLQPKPQNIRHRPIG